MSNTRLTIKDCRINEAGEIVISKVEVIDAISGEIIRPVTINDKLTDFLKRCEYDLDTYFKIEEMKKQNPNFKALISTFNLYT